MVRVDFLLRGDVNVCDDFLHISQLSFIFQEGLADYELVATHRKYRVFVLAEPGVKPGVQAELVEGVWGGAVFGLDDGCGRNGRMLECVQLIGFFRLAADVTLGTTRGVGILGK
jgi:hypothetical protein